MGGGLGQRSAADGRKQAGDLLRKTKNRKRKRRRGREQGGGLSGRRGRTVKNPTHLAGEDRPQVQLLWISNLF